MAEADKDRAAEERLDKADSHSLPQVFGQTRVWTSDELFGQHNEILIVHNDQVYRLRRTRNGKLIMCK
ncbi:MAG: hemin uptake protein HemP [Planctomycetales bacterium]|nr:hemin uptake protein HemP [Planctomycetales bacterium]